MAAAFQAAGTAQQVAGNATISCAWPTHATNDIGILFCEFNDNFALGTGGLATPSGWTLINIKQGGGNTGIAAYWKRAASSSEGNAIVQCPNDGNVTPAYDYIHGVILTFRGCLASGTPWDVTSGAYLGGVTSVAGATTGSANELVVIGISCEDYTTPGADFSGWTNANLANVTERFDGACTLGTRGEMGMASGDLAVAGVYGATTFTNASGRLAGITFSLLSAVVVAPLTQSLNNYQFFKVGDGMSVSEKIK